MKEPKKIKLTDAPVNKNVQLTPLPSLENQYLENMIDDLYSKNDLLEKFVNENNQQNNT